MNTSTFWKGLALVAVVFLFTALEAAAQLPVRTQRVEWINPEGGTVTFDVDYGVGNATTPYTVSWPEDPSAGAGPSQQSILLGTWTGATDINLEWYDIVGFVDGAGAANHVTWWLDDETITYSEAFEWDETSNTFRVGVDVAANNANATGAAGPGTIEVGSGGATSEITLVGNTGVGTFGVTGTSGIVNVANAGANEITLTSATATAVVGATSSGTVNVTNAGTTSLQLDGANATATIGTNGAQAGTIEIEDADGQTITVQTGNQISSHTVLYDIPDATVVSSTFNSPMVRNTATTATQLLVSQGDGTAQWEDNPVANLQVAREALPAAAYTHTVTFPVAYAIPVAATDIVVTANILSGSANIVQVTAVTLTGFTLQSTAPFSAGDEVMYMVNVQ